MSHVVEDFAGICQRNVGVSIVFLEIVHHDSPVSLPDGSIREHVSLREPQLAVLGSWKEATFGDCHQTKLKRPSKV